MSWLTIPSGALHIVLGGPLTAAATTLLLLERARLRRMRGCTRDAARRRFRVTVMLTVLVVAVTVSGALQEAVLAVGPMTALHAATSFGVIALAGRHIWVRRRTLRARTGGRSVSVRRVGLPA